MKKTLLSTAIGATCMIAASNAAATVNYFDWDGMFTMISAGGSTLANTSITGKNVNQHQTPVSGTMEFDPDSGVGTATLVPFDFFNGTLPAEAVGIKMQAIGDGAGGKGTLVLGNMIFNWDGNNGIPVSIVLDAAGFFTAADADWADGKLNNTDASVINNGATPASDGTYVGPPTTIPGTDSGYLSLGPLPMATTEFDTTNINGCVAYEAGPPEVGGCMNNDSSGGLPLITDTAPNTKQYSRGDGVGLGGSPMQDGPFQFKNANFDVTELRFTGSDDTLVKVANCTFVAGDACDSVVVPVPAAVWLFGSGLLGLVGVARRKQSKV